MKSVKTLALMLVAAAGVDVSAQVVFYGGDADGRNGLIASTRVGDDGWSYDDFTLGSATNITGLFGNFLLSDGATSATASWQIRSGMSAGNPGTLIASGNNAATSTATGRTLFGDAEFQFMINGLNTVLGAGTYHMAVSLDNTSGRVFVNTTSGINEGPGGDPNPPPTGGPIANGNTFFTSNQFFATAAPTTTFFGAGTWDFSYGVMGFVPEPSSFLALGLALTSLVALRRRK